MGIQANATSATPAVENGSAETATTSPPTPKTQQKIIPGVNKNGPAARKPNDIIDILRTVAVDPAPGEAIQMKFVLMTVTIESSLSDFAVASHTWSDSEPHKEIIVNNGTLLVPETTYNALYKIWHSNRKLLDAPAYWIAPVCVNQSDIQEKSHQAGLFSQILQKAQYGSRAYIESSEALDERHELFDNYIPFGGSAFQWPNSTGYQKTLEQMPNLIKSGRWNSVLEWLDQPWFSSIWSIPTCTIGSTEFSVRNGFGFFQWSWARKQYLDPLTQLVMVFLDGNSTRANDDPVRLRQRQAFLAAVKLDKFVRITAPNGYKSTISYASWTDSSSMVTLLQDSVIFDAPDPRDRVFALLAIAQPNATETIGTDYSIDLSTLYMKTMEYAINEERSLQVLAYAEPKPHAFRSVEVPSQLPSWVSTWSSYYDIYSLVSQRGKWTAATQQPFSFASASREGNDLSLTAKPISTINKLIPLRTADEAAAAAAELYWRRLAEARRPEDDYLPTDLRRDLTANLTALAHFHIDLPRVRDSLAAAWRHARLAVEPFLAEGTTLADVFARTLTLDGPARRGDGANRTASGTAVPPTTVKEEDEDERLRFDEFASAMDLDGLLPDGERAPYFTRRRSEDTAGGVARRPPDAVDAFLDEFLRRFLDLALAFTDDGRIVAVPPGARVGDRVFLLAGAETPFVLRGAEAGSSAPVYGLVGACYLYGAMEGQLVGEPLDWRRITIR